MRTEETAAVALSSPTYELDLTDVAFGGDAIGRLDGEVIFVPFGMPGERVRVEIDRRKRMGVEADRPHRIKYRKLTK